VITVTPHEKGAVLPVLAQPGARRNAILGERAGSLRVAVTAPPDRGKANEAIQVLLAQCLGLTASRISLIAGATSRQKRFLVEGIEPVELMRRFGATGEALDSTSTRDLGSWE
jgi:uncharacterized protein YggU (UPF0235/DUF167 family)